jgi:hypothetical protein
MCLTRSEREGEGASGPVGDDASFRAIAATRTAQRLPAVTLGRIFFLAAPAAFWCARTLVPSRNTLPRLIPDRCTRSSSCSQTPFFAHRMKVCAAPHHGPSSAGMLRHFAPFSCRQRIASIVRRRLRGGVLPRGRTASISGSNTFHCASLSTCIVRLHPR